jgi:hypothetical protein
MLHRQNLEAGGGNKNTYHYLSVIKELHIVKKLENTVIGTFTRVLGGIGPIDDHDGGKSADVVLLHLFLIGVGVEDLDGSGTAAREGEWTGGKTLEFRRGFLAMTAPIGLENHDGWAFARKPFISIIILTIQAKNNKEKH